MGSILWSASSKQSPHPAFVRQPIHNDHRLPRTVTIAKAHAASVARNTEGVDLVDVRCSAAKEGSSALTDGLLVGEQVRRRLAGGVVHAAWQRVKPCMEEGPLNLQLPLQATLDAGKSGLQHG